MTGARTLGGARRWSAISATAGAGTRLSLSTKDPFGGARAKDTFAVLTRVMVGILAPTMARWQRGLEGGVTFGIVARDVNFASSSIPETELLKPIT